LLKVIKKMLIKVLAKNFIEFKRTDDPPTALAKSIVHVQSTAPSGIRPGAGSYVRIESAPGLCF
jgi:hypothetical protein